MTASRSSTERLVLFAFYAVISWHRFLAIWTGFQCESHSKSGTIRTAKYAMIQTLAFEAISILDRAQSPYPQIHPFSSGSAHREMIAADHYGADVAMHWISGNFQDADDSEGAAMNTECVRCWEGVDGMGTLYSFQRGAIMKGFTWSLMFSDSVS